MSKKKINILLVEDEKSHTDLICRSFESTAEQLSVTVTYNLNEARNSISKSTPDLIITDYILPDGKGIELIPADKEESPYPVIILTSHGDEKVAVEAMKAGAFDYIVKSEVTLGDMPRICERIMREWRLITEHKKAEEALKESEKKYLDLYDNAPDMFFSTDAKTAKFRDCNQAAAIALGYSKEEIIGQHISFITHPDYREIGRKTFQSFVETGVVRNVELHFKRKNGSKLDVVLNATAVRDEQGRILYSRSVCRDITEQKKTERALKESERRFRVIFEQAAIGVALIETKTGQFLRVNKKYCDILGLIPEEVTSTTFMAVTHPGDLQTDLDHMEKLIKGEIQEFSIEKRYCRKDGAIIWVNLTVSPMWKAGESPDYHIAIVDDITEKKRMQGVLLQTEKLKALGVITSGVAHDFNNILAIISGNTQLLQESLGNNKELTADRLSTILKASNDGGEIVRRMRKFIAVEKDVSEFISVNIKDVIEQSINFTMPRWKNMAIAGGIKYDIDIRGIKEVPDISGNPTELREVLINIINNALDVMPEGGTITVATRCVRPSTSAESEELGVESNKANATELQTQNYELKGSFVEITVTDTGTGMTEEVKENIFDPFFTTKRAKGSGLGMSVSYGIIKSHDGNREVESEAGAGSTFTLTFPIDSENRQSKVSPEQTHEIKLEKLRILVIDDEKEICSILEKYFTINGHKVKSFTNCAEAIKILKSEEFDLVLCDLIMPDLTGHDVIEIVDKLDKKPKMGLITGWDEKIESKEKEELKVDFIIKKPFVLSELAKQINELFI